MALVLQAFDAGLVSFACVGNDGQLRVYDVRRQTLAASRSADLADPLAAMAWEPTAGTAAGLADDKVRPARGYRLEKRWRDRHRETDSNQKEELDWQCE